MTEQQIESLASFADSDVFDEREKLALELAVAVSDTPAEISGDLFERLSAQFSQAQLVELAAAAAFENYLARFNRVFDVQPDGFSDGAACPIPDHILARRASG